MNGLSIMRFLTRRRIGFWPRHLDHHPGGGQPRATRWSRHKLVHGVAIQAVVDHQHTTVMGPPYWQARLRVGIYGFEFSTGPRIDRPSESRGR